MITVHIERLVLEGMGLDAAGVDQLRAAVEHHLAGDLASRPLSPELAGGLAVPFLQAADIAIDPGGPGGTGQRLAATLADGLGARTPAANQ
jgi:hypothetical protein